MAEQTDRWNWYNRIMTVPMGPLSTKPTDGSTPNPPGMLYRCKECTLLRVRQEGDTCQECAQVTPISADAVSSNTANAAIRNGYAMCPSCDASPLQYLINTDSFSCASCSFVSGWTRALSEHFQRIADPLTGRVECL